METLSVRLKRLRIRQGLTMAQVARKLAISKSTYRDWEYGVAIRGEPYVHLATILRISVLELLTGENPPSGEAAVKALSSIEAELIILKSYIYDRV
jgi:transcriptional regulator with XRE-family HTH domain